MTAASGYSEFSADFPGVAQAVDSGASGRSNWAMVLRAQVTGAALQTGASGSSLWGFDLGTPTVEIDPQPAGPFRGAGPRYSYLGVGL